MFEAGNSSRRPNFSHPGKSGSGRLSIFSTQSVGSGLVPRKRKRGEKGCWCVLALCCCQPWRTVGVSAADSRTRSPLSSEPKPEQWLALTEDALILRPPRSTVLLEYWSGPFPERWFIYELNRMILSLQGQQIRGIISVSGINRYEIHPSTGSTANKRLKISTICQFICLDCLCLMTHVLRL